MRKSEMRAEAHATQNQSGSHGPSPPGGMHPGFLSHSFDDGAPPGVKWLLQTDLDACADM